MMLDVMFAVISPLVIFGSAVLITMSSIKARHAGDEVPDEETAVQGKTVDGRLVGAFLIFVASGTLVENWVIEPLALRLSLLAVLPAAVGVVAGVLLARATGGLREARR